MHAARTTTRIRRLQVSTSAAASSTTAKASASATTSAAAAAAAPTAEELNASLVALIDPAKPIEEKTALVVDGTKRQANIETMSAALAVTRYAITFNVDNVKVDGQTATADVAVVSPHGAARPPRGPGARRRLLEAVRHLGLRAPGNGPRFLHRITSSYDRAAIGYRIAALVVFV